MRLRLPTLVFLLAVAANPLAAQDVTAVPDFTPGVPNKEQAAALLAAVELHFPLTMQFLRTEFPDDHAAFLASVEEIGGAEGQPVELMLKAFNELTELRRKYADKITFAPGLSQSIMLGLIADLHDRVFATEGPEVCGRFAHDGSAILFALGKSGTYATALDRQSLAYFEAVVGAIETPDYAGDVEPEDWNVLLSAMVSAGAPTSYVKTIGEGRRTDPDLCPAYAALFRTSGLLNTPEGLRTRADFAKNLAGY